jgi:beta-glucosidase
VGASSSDIRLRCTIEIPGEKPQKQDLPSYESCRIQAVGDEEFARLLGRPIPEDTYGAAIGLNDALCRLEQAKSPAARLLHKGLKNRLDQAQAQGKADTVSLFVYNMPVRAIAKNAGKHFSPQMAQDFLELCNGKTVRGACKLMVDLVKNEIASRQYKKKLK